MKDKDLYLSIDQNEKSNFMIEATNKNINRGIKYSKIVIFIELILSIANMISSKRFIGTGFKFDKYLIMYLIMILINVVFYVILKSIKEKKENIITAYRIIAIYIILMMNWGAVVSLMDQKLYGQITAYMVNVIACSIIYYLDNKVLILSYLTSGIILFIGLIFFQKTGNILVGHYINSLIFIFFSYINSRILYRNLYNDFKHKKLIDDSNKRLKKEIKEKEFIQHELESANGKLIMLSFSDELTKVNNRRALREFINSIFSNKESKIIVSIIMMDVDEFKLYNDKYGHVMGDEALARIAAELNKISVSLTHFVARYGGEEFIYIAVKTDENEIKKIAEKIKENICSLKIPHKYSRVEPFVTLSLGVATVYADNKNMVYEGIMNADAALYDAKARGKNKVISYNSKI